MNRRRFLGTTATIGMGSALAFVLGRESVYAATPITQSSSTAYKVFADSADANPTSSLEGGALKMGPGGASAVDVTLSRLGANQFGGTSIKWVGASIGPSTSQQHTLPAVASDTLAVLAANQTISGSNTFSSRQTFSVGFILTPIADAANANKLFISSTTANTLKYYDNSSALRSVVDLSLAQTLTTKTISGGTFSGTIAGTPTYSGSAIFTPTQTYSAGLILTAIADSSTANKLFRSTTTANTLKYYDGIPTLHQLVVLDIAATFTAAMTFQGLNYNVPAAKTTTYGMTANDVVILADATSAGFTVTLPAASNKGQHVIVIKIDAGINAVTVARAGSDTIEGATSVSLSAQYKKFEGVADGTATWYDLGASLV